MNWLIDWYRDWLLRHQNRTSWWLHIVGIPLTVLGAGLAIGQLIAASSDPAVWGLWWRPATLVILGYALQYLGHVLEGNDMGEIIVIKRWLGVPYVAISPRYEQPDAEPATFSNLSRESAR